MASAFAKLSALRQRLRGLRSVLVAYSGGVDSSLLAKVACDELGERALAVTVRSELHPDWEIAEAAALATDIGLRHRVQNLAVLSQENVASNPPERCYYCKQEILKALRAIAIAEGIECLAEGSTADDDADFRPGRRAVQEAGAISPLREAGLTKAEIRGISRDLGLPTWDKASFACLASRIPYGEPLTAANLQQIAKAESVLRELGLRQFRVRFHGDVARIEVDEADIPRVAGADRRLVLDRVRAAGFRYVALDLAGYQSGGLNPPPADRPHA